MTMNESLDSYGKEESLLAGKGRSTLLERSVARAFGVGAALLRSDTLAIVVLYAVAHAAMLANDGVFWDDWCNISHSRQDIVEHSRLGGWILYGHIKGFLVSLPHPALTHRLVVFSCFLASVLCVYGIIGRVREISPPARFMLTTVFAVFPVNVARIAFNTLLYAYCNAAFFLAFWLLTVSFENGRRAWLRPLIIGLFFVSFTTGSILVFYVVLVGAYVVYARFDTVRTRWQLAAQVLRLADLVLLPVVFWAIKQTFFVPGVGLFERYQILPSRVIAFPGLFPIAWAAGFVEPLRAALSEPPFVLCVLCGLLLYAVVRGRVVDDGLGISKRLGLCLFGLILFAASVFPYIVVGRSPLFLEWGSRHQLLVPLGSAFMLYYGLTAVGAEFRISKRVQTLALASLIACFVATNVSRYVTFQRDWYKQLSLIEQFRRSPAIRLNTSFLFRDLASELNALDRKYRFYEYAGLMRSAFGDASRFGIAEEDYRSVEEIRPYTELPVYNVSDFDCSPPQYLVTVVRGTQRLGLEEMLQLFSARLTNPRAFQERVADVVEIRVEPLAQPGSAPPETAGHVRH